VRAVVRRHRASIALVLSLLAHGLVLLWLSRQKPPAPAMRAALPVELRIVHLPPLQSKEHRSSAQTAKKPAGGQMHEPSHVATRPPSSPPPGAASSAKPGGAPGHSTVSSLDSPVTRNLLPNLPLGSDQGPGVQVPSHGQTIHNDGSGPDEKAVAAYDAERAQRTVQDWTTDLLADARAQRGLPGPYFSAVKEALEAELNSAPPNIDKKAFGKPFQMGGAAALEEMGKQYSRYGKTGNPLGDVDPDTDDVQTRNSPNMQAMLRDPGGQTPQGQIGAALAGMEPARQMLRRGTEEAKLSAVVELLQAKDGAVREAHLRKTSGNRAFDEGVLAAAPKAIAKLQPPSGPGLGTHADAIRSLWEFQGKLNYKKNAHGMSGSDIAKNALSSFATGQLAFDETQGVEMLDMEHPTLEFTAKLLRLY
jgi:hypothetical protein